MKWSGDKIKLLRLRLGWSQAELARRLGCRQQTVSEWETNVYQPQNAYSRLLDMMLNSIDEYSTKMNQRTLSEIVMKDLGVSQVSSSQVNSSPLTPSQLSPTQVQVTSGDLVKIRGDYEPSFE